MVTPLVGPRRPEMDFQSPFTEQNQFLNSTMKIARGRIND